MYPLILFIIAMVGALVQLSYSSKKNTFKRAIEVLLAWILPLNIGMATLIGFIGHAFYSRISIKLQYLTIWPQIAAKIGWPAHNPFQFEVAIGNLAMSVAGFFCIWQKKGFWMATALFSAIFFLGAAYGHLVQMLLHGNYSPYNSGIFLYIGDIVIPLIYLALTFIYCLQNKFFKNS